MHLPGYDAWKTRGPDDDAPTCDRCGGWLGSRPIGDVCDDCHEEIASYEWAMTDPEEIEP